MLKQSKYYYKDGSVLNYLDSTKVLHREDGPAIFLMSGTKIWYINGKCCEILSKNVIEKYMKANNYTLSHLLSDSDSVLRKSTNLLLGELRVHET